MNDEYIEMKNYIEAIPENDISVKTQTDYIKTYTRLFNNNKNPFDYERKSTHYKYRAAFIYANTLLARIKLKEIEDKLDEDKRKSEIAEFKSIVNLLKSYLDDEHIVFKKSSLQKSLSKKLDVAKLKKSWSVLMYEKLNKDDSIYMEAVCVLMLTGARGIEVTTGVTVEDHIDGLRFTIKGAKRHAGDKYGQVERSFVVQIEDDPHYQHLKQKMGNGVNNFEVKIDSAKLLGEQIRRNSKIVMPGEIYISPYTYRHNFSRLLKGSGIDSDSVSMALGHCTDRSKKYYSAASGKSFFRISEIKGSKKIKHVVNKEFLKTMVSIAPAMC